jgi:hypothetical protein
MGYERVINNTTVIFVAEEDYLKCRLGYINYTKEIPVGHDYLPFIDFIKNEVDNPAVDWDIESIDDSPVQQSNTLTFQLDPSGELSEGCIVNIDSNPIGIATNYDPNSQIASVSLSSGMYVGADGQILYTTYAPGTEQVDNLNNGWTRTTRTYDLSTDSPDVRNKKLEEEKKRNEFNRFDIIDFD